MDKWYLMTCRVGLDLWPHEKPELCRKAAMSSTLLAAVQGAHSQCLFFLQGY